MFLDLYPLIGLLEISKNLNPFSFAYSMILLIIFWWWISSTIPPFETRFDDASNCGLINTINFILLFKKFLQTSKTFFTLIKETSQLTKSMFSEKNVWFKPFKFVFSYKITFLFVLNE